MVRAASIRPHAIARLGPLFGRGRRLAVPNNVQAAWLFLGRPSLARRSMAFSVLGLALSLALLGTVTLWTVDDMTQQEYHERLDLAIATARHVDHALGTDLQMLQQGADAVSVPVTPEQVLGLDSLADRLGRPVRLQLDDSRQTVVWQDSRRPVGSTALPMERMLVESVLSTGRGQTRPCGNADEDQSDVLVCLGAPVHDQHGTTTGVLFASIDPRDASLGLLPFTDLGGEMQISLIDADGDVTTAPNTHTALLADLLASRTSGLRVHPGSGNVSSHITAFAPTAAAPDMGVVVEQPRDIALAASRQLELRFGLVAVILLILGGGAVWWDVRRVSGPLGRLTVAAERFAAGQLDDRVRPEGAGELRSLANAFEIMRQRLRTSLGELAGWNHELEARVATRTVELEQRNKELANINAIADAVSRTFDVQVMLDQTLNMMLAITEADMACFHLAWERGARPTLVAERNALTAIRETGAEQIQSLCTRVIAQDSVTLLNDAEFQAEAPDCHAAGLRTCLLVPVRAEPEPQGILLLGSSRSGAFSDVQPGTLAAIGRQVGMALANARLYKRLETRQRERAELLQRAITGQEEERRRLAQELHDQTSQTLASLQLGLDQLAVRSGEPEIRARATELQRAASAALADVHRLAVELRPSVLDDVGLGAALERYVTEVQHRFGIPVEFASVGLDGVRLAPAPATVVYRVVQAAVTNAVQHARPHEISILLQRRGDDIQAVVEDDGQGFDLGAVQASPLEYRLGLAGMQERAALVHGTLTFETEPGAGTTVFLRVPMTGNIVHAEDAQHAAAGTG
jgi:signal transduction histidine kinase